MIRAKHKKKIALENVQFERCHLSRIVLGADVTPRPVHFESAMFFTPKKCRKKTRFTIV